jgi:predicted secreted protein
MQHILGDAENGKTIQVHIDDEIHIALNANLTTGYRWDIEKGDESLLMLQHERFSAASRLMGSGGTQLFTFVAQCAGTGHLHFKYWRSFAGEKSVTRRFTVVVQIQDEPEGL